MLTASKDGSLVVSRVEGGGGTAALAAEQRYDELHAGVVKCACWRDATTFGSCGNDRTVCVVDTRQPPTAGALGRMGVLSLACVLCAMCRAAVPASGSPRHPRCAGAAVLIAGAHGSATNCLRWHPSCEHLALSASHDPAILLHDLRCTAQPLHRLLGHATAARWVLVAG